MSNFLKNICAAAVLGAALVPAPAPALAASDEDQATVERAEQYFDDITTVQSRFIQTNPDGTYLNGTLKMQRPGRMHIDYGDEAQLEVVADGTFFILVDHKLRNTTYLPLETTAAHLLLREDFRLGEDITVSEVDAGEGLVRLTLEKRGEEDVGSVTVVLNADPMQLRQWIIEDQQGQKTRVTLLDPRFGVSFDEGAFDFENPYPTSGRNER